MKILVTGANGQLGNELRDLFEEKHPGITTYVDVEQLDITDREAVENFIKNNDFTHIINCAAYTSVDKAEEDKMTCAAVNIDGIANLGRIANELGIKVIHISTDYVFDGKSFRPYSESDKVNPTSQYGTTKRKGETALLGLAPDAIIVRTGWLYSTYGNNFVKTMLRLGQEKTSLKVVCDQIGTPTYAADLARALENIIFARQWHPGIIHFSNEGVCSWYDLAVATHRLAGIKGCHISPVMSEDYPTLAVRPHYSVLDKSKYRATYSASIPHWQEALQRCIECLQNK